eukprot:8343896-Alexandrium_andersonii.AAC.1
MSSASAWNGSCKAACAAATPTSPSVATKHRVLASASSAAARARPASSWGAIGESSTGVYQAAVSCSYPMMPGAAASVSASTSK